MLAKLLVLLMCLSPAPKPVPCCAQREDALRASLSLPGAGAHLQPFRAGCSPASCLVLCSCLWCLDLSSLLIPSRIPGVCTRSQVAPVPGEGLGHHQLCQGGRISSGSLLPPTRISLSVGRAGKRSHSPFSLFFLPCATGF